MTDVIDAPGTPDATRRPDKRLDNLFIMTAISISVKSNLEPRLLQRLAEEGGGIRRTRNRSGSHPEDTLIDQAR